MISLFDQVKNIPQGLSIIHSWLGSGGRVVDKDTAQQRTNVCLTCPKNVLGFSIAKPVSDAIRRHLEVKNHAGLRVSGEKSLGTCEACGCRISLLVWLPGDKVKSETTDEERTELPDFCWKLKA